MNDEIRKFAAVFFDIFAFAAMGAIVIGIASAFLDLIQ